MVLEAGFANLQALSAALDVYTGRYHECQGAAAEYSHICLAQRPSLVLSSAHLTLCNHLLVQEQSHPIKGYCSQRILAFLRLLQSRM